ncbi:MAG: hypothetical protein JNM00_01280 [Flavobacteriales bacterium]|nr:hypothetical protein [Flavobacteriales bacterium]
MKTSLMLICAALLLCSAGELAPLLWSGDKLSWENYRKRAGNQQYYKAFTYSGIRFTTGERDGKSMVSVEAFFDPNESWVHPGNMTSQLLNHEQRHFDLTEVYARKMRDAVSEWNNIPIEEFIAAGHPQHIRDAYMQLNNELFKKQQQYDVETRHGSDTASQQQWDAWIDDQLKQ